MTTLPDFSFFKKLADAAKAATLPHFRHVLSIDNKEKSGFDPVTNADRETEIRLREIIRSDRPQDGILGEEFPTHSGSNDYTWVIDPIDGTRSFISGMPIWGSLVGLKHKEKAVAGMMAQPFTGEIFYCCGEGSYFYHDFGGTNRKLKTSTCKTLAEATLFSTAPELFEGEKLDRFTAIKNKARLTRYSADCYAFAMLAAGCIDLVVETDLKPYDIMALIPIIEQAGGVITNWQGGKAEDAGDIVAAATPDLHSAALKMLNN